MAKTPSLSLHKDSLCNDCTLLNGGACPYLQLTLDDQLNQSAPVSACAQFTPQPAKSADTSATKE